MSGLAYTVMRGGTLHFRFTIPTDLRRRFGRGELRFSLGTGRTREARGAALALAGFTLRFMESLRGGAMQALTSEEIFELTRREFRRILDDDRRARLQHPDTYAFGAGLTVEGKLAPRWYDPEAHRDDHWLVCGVQDARDYVHGLLASKKWPEFRGAVVDMFRFIALLNKSHRLTSNRAGWILAQDALFFSVQLGARVGCAVTPERSKEMP